MSGASSPAPIAGSRTSVLRRMYRPSFAPVSPLGGGAVLAGKYRIESLLGQGGMGAVYRATRLADQSVVAVKVMRSEHASDASMAERFHREAEVVRGVDSQRISAVYDFGQTADGTLYLAMELLRGMSLTAHLENEVLLPWREALRIAREVALALDAVHSAGVIHRDLKPDNIYVCDDGAIKLLDFGIAKEFAPNWAQGQVKGKPLTQAGIVVGTPLYMSPEAVTQSPMGPPTDLYALGAVLFEMLTGRLLFEEPEPVILMGHQLRTRPERVRAVGGDPDLPPALDALVDELLAKDPRKRPASARAVADALERIDASVPRGAVQGPIVVGAKPRRSEAQIPTHITTAPDEATPNEATTVERTAVVSAAERTWGEPTTREPMRAPAMATAITAHEAKTDVTPALRPALDTSRARALVQRWGAGVVVAAVALGGLALWASAGATTPEAIPLAPATTVTAPGVIPPSSAPDVPVAVLPAVPSVVPSTVPTTAPSATDVPALATVRFETVPADAHVSEGDTAVTGGVVQLPRDGREHVFVVEAPGRVSQRVRVSADEDRTVRVSLRRVGSTAPAGGPATGGGDIAREF